MQDKYKNTDPLSPAFENMAWEQMSAMLDQEKPVVVPFWKRSLPLLLVFGLLLSGVIAYAFVSIETKEDVTSSSILPVNASSENAESKPDLKQDQNTNTTTVETTSSNSEIKKEKEFISSPYKKQRLEEGKKNRGQSILKSNKATQSHQNLFFTNPVLQRILPKLPSKTLSPSKLEKPIVSDEKEEPIASIEPILLSAFEPVPFLGLKELKEEGDLLNLAEGVQQKNKNNRFVFGGSLGINHDYSLKLYTASVGFDVWKPFSSRFGLKSGIHFQHTRSNNEVFSWASAEGLEFFNSNDSTGAIPWGQTSKQYSLNKTNSLALPLEAYFRLSPKVSIRGGLETAFRLSSSLFNGQGNRALDTPAVDQNAELDTSADSDLIFKKMDLRGKIGVDFFPTDHIVLGLSYHIGLSPFTQSEANVFSLRTKTISLNAGIRF